MKGFFFIFDFLLQWWWGGIMLVDVSQKKKKMLRTIYKKQGIRIINDWGHQYEMRELNVFKSVDTTRL